MEVRALRTPEIGLRKRSSRGYLAQPTSPAPRGLGRGREEKLGFGEPGEGSSHARMREGERGERGERLLKELRPRPSRSPPPPSVPTAPAPRCRVQLQTCGVQGLTFLLLLSSLLFWKGWGRQEEA